jgi:hypothetical protein
MEKSRQIVLRHHAEQRAERKRQTRARNEREAITTLEALDPFYFAPKPVPVFTPAASTEDAEAFAESLGVERADFGRHLHAANIVCEGLCLLKSRGAEMPLAVLASAVPFLNQTSKVTAFFDVGDDVLFVNPDKEAWSKDVERVRSDLFASGWLSSGHRCHGVFHEIGHKMHYLQSPHLFDEDPDFSEEARFELEDKVSRYAMKDPVEFVAEVFAGRMAGREFDEVVDRWYRHFGGPDLAPITRNP